MRLTGLLTTATWVSAVSAGLMLRQTSQTPTTCPGYNASNVQQTDTGLTADLTLAGDSCDVYGTDIVQLRLTVSYDTASRLHVKIEDVSLTAYQLPESIMATPNTTTPSSADDSDLAFSYQSTPFSFAVTRKSTQDVLFNSSAASLIFEDQYIRLRTSLPEDPYLYGLGEKTDPFRLNTTNYTRTLWNRDAYGVPPGTNLYGHHPVYYDHRGDNGTHAVFLKTSVGMDVKVDNNAEDGQYLEYNVLGGVLDLYFLSGPGPVEAAQQYSGVVGTPYMPPYWAFGLHQCRYGYRDFYSIAEVIYNYSAAGIPLETMWTDIDYMYQRYIMTTDPNRFPVDRVRDYVDYLHAHDQHYIVMVDPAIAYQTERDGNQTYETFVGGQNQGVFLQKNGTTFQGVVWPGVTAFPDWFHPNTTQFWIDQFASFFNAGTGIDIDGLWIDMNEASNFNHFGDDPQETMDERNFPPQRSALRSSPREIPGFPAAFQPNASSPYPPDPLSYSPPWLAVDASPNSKRSNIPLNYRLSKRQDYQPREIIGYPSRDLLEPPYQIDNTNTVTPYGGLSNLTLDTDIVHYDGHVELDVHNLYGSMMSRTSRTAMESRRPGRRPLVVTRSTFAGDGAHTAKWLGDNLSTWELYRQSIQGMLDFAALFQIPMVGSDVCGFGGNTTETLCARWATLGAFYPFYRNHNGDSSLPQEFYLWDSVAAAARNAIDIRYRLLDYTYTALYQQATDGTPMINPYFFLYPNDTNTFDIELQFFYGNSLLISPVTEENSTDVTIYLPNDLFYDFTTYNTVQGSGNTVTLNDIDYTDIPIHIRGGSIIPLRNSSANTTMALRQQPFHFLIAPGASGSASGNLYLDDGDSITQDATSFITMDYVNGVLNVMGDFGYTAEGNSVARITLLGVQSQPSQDPTFSISSVDQSSALSSQYWTYDAQSQSLEIQQEFLLERGFSVNFNM